MLVILPVVVVVVMTLTSVLTMTMVIMVLAAMAVILQQLELHSFLQVKGSCLLSCGSRLKHKKPGGRRGDLPGCMPPCKATSGLCAPQAPTSIVPVGAEARRAFCAPFCSL